MAGLLKHGPSRIVSPDLVMLKTSGPNVIADCNERKFYLRTDFVEKYPAAKALFERSRCENVITNKDLCENQECLYGEECDLDKGELYCFIASNKSRALLDPYWLGGPEKHTKRSHIRNVLIFTQDNFGAISKPLPSDQALTILEDGRPPSAAIGEISQPFYNPYNLTRNSERIQQQKRFYKRVLEHCPAHLININAGSPKDVQKVVVEICSGKGREVLR